MKVYFLTDWRGYSKDVVYDIQNDALLKRLLRSRTAIPIAKSIAAPVRNKMMTGAPINK